MRRDNETFILTEDHLKLLQRAIIGWEDCEYGAPSIDCKRPYGNSSVAIDICEILGWDFDDEDGPTDEQRDAADNIHRETQTALQIVLLHLHIGIKPGTYMRRETYDSRSWVLVGPPHR